MLIHKQAFFLSKIDNILFYSKRFYYFCSVFIVKAFTKLWNNLLYQEFNK